MSKRPERAGNFRGVKTSRIAKFGFVSSASDISVLDNRAYET